MYKRKLTHKWIPVGLLLIGFGLPFSCKDYLTTMPDNRAIINSTEKIELLLASAYNSTAHFAFTEPQTDNVTDDGKINRFDRINDFAYRWDVNDQDTGADSPLGYWTDCYKAIAVANQALVSIAAMGENAENQAAKGEALLIRAYNHFMLVNLWAKHYHRQTAAQDPGVPYVTEPEEEPFKKYTRNSVQEVYDAIERDMLEGLELVGRDYISPKYRFTPEAGKAFATRFYLSRGNEGDWEKVIAYANELLFNPSKQLRDWSGTYWQMSSSALEILYPGPDENANILIAAGPSYYNRVVSGSPGRFCLSSNLARQLFVQNNLFSLTWAYKYYQYEIGGNQFVPKFNENFVYSNRAAGIGNGYLQFPLLTYDEVFLNRIEAYVMLNRLEEARLDLGVYFSKKLFGYNANTMPVTDQLVQHFYKTAPNELHPNYSLTVNQEAYVKCAAELRRREFIHEGIRWFDIKRLGLTIKHPLVSEDTLVLAKEDLKRVMQIPKAAQASGLVPNIR